MKALKIVLKSDLGAFRDMSEHGALMDTKQLPNNIQLGGMLGAIVGLDGIQKRQLDIYENNTVDFPEYYKQFLGINYSIVPKEPIFNKEYYTLNNHYGANVNRPDFKSLTTQTKYSVLEKPEYTVYVYEPKEDSKKGLYNELKEFLADDVTTYPFYFGLSHMLASYDYLGEVDLKKLENKEDIRINSWYLVEDVSYNEFYENDEKAIEYFQQRESYHTKLTKTIVRTDLKQIELSTQLLTTEKDIYQDTESELNLYPLEF